jgi:hypothetical protein
MRTEGTTLTPSPMAQRLLHALHIDFAPSHRSPSLIRVVAATVLAVCGSLAADAVLVIAGTAAFPSTRGYVHFQFGDYAKLTIIGVLVACAAWPIVCRVAAKPTWLFSRLAVLVTVVLLLPDAWLLHQHQPSRAVAVLVLMHLAIAFVTYFALVLVAPARRSVTSRNTAPSMPA